MWSWQFTGSGPQGCRSLLWGVFIWDTVTVAIQPLLLTSIVWSSIVWSSLSQWKYFNGVIIVGTYKCFYKDGNILKCYSCPWSPLQLWCFQQKSHCDEIVPFWLHWLCNAESSRPWVCALVYLWYSRPEELYSCSTAPCSSPSGNPPHSTRCYNPLHHKQTNGPLVCYQNCTMMSGRFQTLNNVTTLKYQINTVPCHRNILFLM